MLQSKTWSREFYRLFPSQSATDVQIARLCVLFEDLKIEALCAIEEQISAADHLSAAYRRLYFLRKSLATLEEFHSAFQQLNMDRDFRASQRAWSKDHRHQWAAMIKFFSGKRPLLKGIRNAVGGHFSDAAARHALAELCQRSAGTISIVAHPSRTGAELKLSLAGDLAANALTKDRDSVPELEFVEQLFEFNMQAYGHAVRAMYVVAHNFLIPQS